MAKTTIHCTKCSSTVPWGPHCPECGAYLEFAGEPPWRPGPDAGMSGGDGVAFDDTSAPVPAQPHEVILVEETVVSTRGVSDSSRATASGATSMPARTGHGPLASIVVIIAGVILTPVLWWATNRFIAIAAAVVFLVWAAVLAPRGGQSAGPGAATGRGPIASIVLLAAGVIVTPVLWWATNPVIAIAAAVVFLVWAVILWPRRTEAPAGDPLPAAAVTETVIREVVVEEIVVDQPPVAEVLARAPQVLPPRVAEATRPIAVRAPGGDVPCSTCLRLNTADVRFCRWCGVPTDVDRLAPATVAVLEGAVSPAGTAQEKQGRPSRGPSRSWRAPLLLVTLLGVFLASISFALFGPGAFRVQLGLTRVYQAINQFIDPYSGDQADIESTTASSSLKGTTPQDAQGADATTFWASASSPSMGAGSELVFTFTDPYTIDRMVILPGIQNANFDPRAVATPKVITLEFDDGTTHTARLDLIQREGNLQQLVRFPRVMTRNVILRINEVYPPRYLGEGETESEVAVSGARFLTPPVPPNVFNLPSDIQPRSTLPGTTS